MNNSEIKVFMDITIDFSECGTYTLFKEKQRLWNDMLEKLIDKYAERMATKIYRVYWRKYYDMWE
jgi:hypothetical protein